MKTNGQNKTQNHALVRRVEKSSGAIEVSPKAVSDAKALLMRADTRNFMQTVFWVGGTANLLALVTMASANPVLSGILVGGYTLAAAFGDKERRENIKEAAERAHEELRESVRDACDKSYKSRQKQLITAAESHLADGGVLDMEALSYLVLTPSYGPVREVSDRLAITVMQARQMLAYMRQEGDMALGMDMELTGFCAVGMFKTIRGREATPPPTFSSQGLDPRKDDDRAQLRRLLADCDAVSLYDQGTSGLRYPEPELPVPELFKGGFLKKAWRVAAAPYYIYKDKKTLRQYKMPELPAFEPLPLRQVQDFPQILADFERAHGPLDLPALRRPRSGAVSLLLDQHDKPRVQKQGQKSENAQPDRIRPPI